MALREPKATQRLVRVLAGNVATNAVAEGSLDVAVSVASSVYTFTFNEVFARKPIVVVSSETAAKNLQVHTRTTSGFKVSSFAVDGTTPADADFSFIVWGFDAVDAI